MNCLTPLLIRNRKPYANTDQFEFHKVPCGKCPTCLERRTGGWIFRLLQEQKVSSSSHFVTFTYEDTNLPYVLNRETGELTPTLVKKHLQNFFKNVRTTEKKLKYYACGEHGEKTDRPHYHAIIFNADPVTLANRWPFGHTQIDEANAKTMAYVAKYINKSKGDKRHFAIMSKKLGQSYLTKQMMKYHKEDPTRQSCMENGSIYAMPRYYKEKIFTQEEKELAAKHFQDKYTQQEQKFIDTQLKKDKENPYHYRTKQIKAAFDKKEKTAKTKRNKL